MEKHCTMVYFSLRESKQNKKGLSPIEVSITTNGKRIYFSTGKHVPATDWNKEKQAVKGKSEEAQLINGYLIQVWYLYITTSQHLTYKKVEKRSGIFDN